MAPASAPATRRAWPTSCGACAARWRWIPRTEKKWILRNALRQWPSDILDRRKQGFMVPLSDWLRHDLHGQMCDVLLDPGAASHTYFRPGVIRDLIDVHDKDADGAAKKLWASANAQMNGVESGSRAFASHPAANSRNDGAGAPIRARALFPAAVFTSGAAPGGRKLPGRGAGVGRGGAGPAVQAATAGRGSQQRGKRNAGAPGGAAGRSGWDDVPGTWISGRPRQRYLLPRRPPGSLGRRAEEPVTSVPARYRAPLS